MKCDFCKNEFINKYTMQKHQQRTKYCIDIQKKLNIETKEDFKQCEYCQKKFEYDSYNRHQKICTFKKDKTIINITSELILLKEELQNLKKDNERLLSDNMNLERKLELHEEKLYIMASRPTISTINNNIISDYTDDPTTILIEEDENKDEEHKDEEYKLLPLDVGQGYTIEHRDEDGFINVTNICKAGDKQFKAWFRLDKTKAFLQVLSESVLIHTDSLIKYNTAYGKERATWSHPQVAINIAQWISPRFDVKVSAWVYEVMMTGKVDISNTKSYRQLQSENKDKELKIQYLTKKYVKRQPRVDYQERNVVYILTTSNMKKERRYILGKAENLTNRLSVYNKSDEHEVIYYQECSDEEKMNIAETMVFNKLKEYREQANRERFILPKEKDIEYFKDTIKKVIEFLN